MKPLEGGGYITRDVCEKDERHRATEEEEGGRNNQSPLLLLYLVVVCVVSESIDPFVDGKGARREELVVEEEGRYSVDAGVSIASDLAVDLCGIGFVVVEDGGRFVLVETRSPNSSEKGPSIGGRVAAFEVFFKLRLYEGVLRLRIDLSCPLREAMGVARRPDLSLELESDAQTAAFSFEHAPVGLDPSFRARDVASEGPRIKVKFPFAVEGRQEIRLPHQGRIDPRQLLQSLQELTLPDITPGSNDVRHNPYHHTPLGDATRRLTHTSRPRTKNEGPGGAAAHDTT